MTALRALDHVRAGGDDVAAVRARLALEAPAHLRRDRARRGSAMRLRKSPAGRIRLNVIVFAFGVTMPEIDGALPLRYAPKPWMSSKAPAYTESFLGRASRSTAYRMSPAVISRLTGGPNLIPALEPECVRSCRRSSATGKLTARSGTRLLPGCPGNVIRANERADEQVRVDRPRRRVELPGRVEASAPRKRAAVERLHADAVRATGERPRLRSRRGRDRHRHGDARSSDCEQCSFAHVHNTHPPG